MVTPRLQLEWLRCAKVYFFMICVLLKQSINFPHFLQLDYVFYGTHKLDERCRQFFEEIDRRLKQDSCFRSLNDEQLICAHDGIEQYVMHRIGQHAYKLTETVEEDQLLMRRMKVLSTFLTPDHLEIPPAFFQEDMLSQAGQELKAINNFRTPGDKVACIVSVDSSL